MVRQGVTKLGKKMNLNRRLPLKNDGCRQELSIQEICKIIQGILVKELFYAEIKLQTEAGKTL